MKQAKPVQYLIIPCHELRCGGEETLKAESRQYRSSVSTSPYILSNACLHLCVQEMLLTHCLRNLEKTSVDL